MNLSLSARRCLLGWVLLALLGAQALGQLHRVVHAQGASAAHAHRQAAATGDFPGPQAETAGGLEALFAAHEGYASGCLSFDAVGHDGLAPAAAAAAPALPPMREGVAPAPSTFVECRGSPFQARGPPLSR